MVLKRSLVLLALFFFTMASTSHAAARPTGNELLRYCKTAINWMDSGSGSSSEAALTCLWYIRGFVDGADMAALERASRQPTGRAAIEALDDEAYCVPEGVTTGQLIRVVVKYLEAQPQDLHNDLAWLVGAAVSDAYPC